MRHDPKPAGGWWGTERVTEQGRSTLLQGHQFESTHQLGKSVQGKYTRKGMCLLGAFNGQKSAERPRVH